MRTEIYELNDETRQSMGGSFIQLPNGITHYELGGPASGELIVLVHGFLVPNFIFEPTFKFLTQSGLRVLRYDQFGRGFSDRPNTRYNLDLFVTQLRDLLDALRLIQPVSLIGLSMGGPITTAFTVRHPARVNKLVLIDPSGARAIAFSPLIKLITLPFVAETILSVIGSEPLLRAGTKDFYDPALVDRFMSHYRLQMQYKGFMRTVLSSVRNDMLGSFIGEYKALGKTDKPVMILFGRQDKTVPFEQNADLCAAMPQAQLQVVEDCGHVPHYEKPDEVNPILMKFLRPA